jgi:hypothetical protein
MLLLAAGFALQVLRHWDIASGSELQLALERRTYLISTLLTYVFVAELAALLLYVYNAESLASRFVGAMCATGVLNVNGWGWPTLFLKAALFFAGAVWLMLNRLDNQGFDYPLVRWKYGLLLAIAPLGLAEAAAQTVYFLRMDPDVITSCCGSLFTPEGDGVAAELAGLAPRHAMISFVGASAAFYLSGAHLLWRQRGGVWFAVAAAAAFVASLVAVVSFVALYVYEHPHHHCPFCVLEAGHGYVGYGLYLPLFGATAFALGAGVVHPCRRIPSLRQAAAVETRRYTVAALLLFLVFHLVTARAVLGSSLTMAEVWW